MAEPLTCDLCVIGGGAAGLAVAAGAAQMGARTVLFERGKMGGDCLHYGCVPSKALLAAARAADTIRRAERFGVVAPEPEVRFAQVRDHVRAVIAAIEPHDSVARFEGLGVRVIQQSARFTGGRELIAEDGTRVAARRVVVATGSVAAVPPIPGLDTVPFLTNETIFDNAERPAHLVIIGGGPIGAEMAQAHRRLGSDVTVLEADRILSKDDPELVEVVRTRLTAEGVRLREGASVECVAASEDGVELSLAGPDASIRGSHLLVATGRRAVVDGLDLEVAGIAYTPRGITVDARLRTSNRYAYAIGDVAGGPQFTHMAAHHAGIVLRNALFRLPARADRHAMPWVTYTDPELANVGMTEATARERYPGVRVERWPLADNNRARAEQATEGLIKLVADRRGRVLGAGIVGLHAGELLQPWILAIDKRLRLSTMAGLIVPYPTLGEINKRVAGAFYAPRLFSERTRKLVRLLARLG